MKVGRETAGLKRIIRRFALRKIAKMEFGELEQLRFYQFKSSTAKFFYDRFGRTDIRVLDTPHFSFARSISLDQGRGEGEQYYRDYLAASWGEASSEERINARVKDFRAHFEHCRTTRNVQRPTITRILNTSDPFVIDGNHRTAMLAALQKPASVEILPPDLATLIFSRSTEFYGTGFRDMPYQSVFLNGEEVIKGRRNDALARLKLLPDGILKGASVLDVASNIGMSSLFAHRLGASKCVGLEISRKMVDFASRFAMFDGRYPQVQFRQFNIDDDELAGETRYDTAFMFSIHDHLKRPSNLLKIAEEAVDRYVVFEGHPNGKQEDYSGFFESGIFKNVQQLGVLPESVFNQSMNRILWLCEK
ncbi:class I SAM-dependent methyltransferase [Agrobacterium vaccinii]|uniref:class I SAM-dependent methyltransferase n=1 Tax=Agrobacterium vaccinii TaxID=2735528 RepID=UPI001E4B69F2|nr:class I SAM-dependent methyltransferase [Agrobacterium vaccinii]UHS61066.1 class I SAM-dependent methyltransferase [Agrobacterium vaccinii]